MSGKKIGAVPQERSFIQFCSLMVVGAGVVVGARVVAVAVAELLVVDGGLKVDGVCHNQAVDT